MGNHNLLSKTVSSLKNDGIKKCANKVYSYAKKQSKSFNTRKNQEFKDVLFIDGCGDNLLHCSRYRVIHQMEQLEANNISCSSVFYENLDINEIYLYRLFVIYRCPYTEELSSFVKKAKMLNKKVLYDIDDLVIDTPYTDSIDFLNELSANEREAYNANVNSMGKMLKTCGSAITTTSCMKDELLNYVSEVYINRNVISDEMVSICEKSDKNSSDRIKIGYFSGSISHNNDLKLILPVLEKMLERYANLELHFVGEISIPKELKEFEQQITFHPYMDWKKLPLLIASVDINIAPLEKTIFNEAKSEIKWIEAAMVKTPTVASNVGAFAEMIEHDKTGLLCDSQEEWTIALSELIECSDKRAYIAGEAYDFCKRHCVTMYTGSPFCSYLRRMMASNIGFVLPGLVISGGIRVALKHAAIMSERGYDVFLITENPKVSSVEYDGKCLPVLSKTHMSGMGRVEKMIATMWTTVKFVEQYNNVAQRYYLVQGFETDFYPPGNPFRMAANASYTPNTDFQFITISGWCQEWLLSKYNQQARLAHNGIDLEKFSPHSRAYEHRIRILIEGDNDVAYKNVDESFRIVENLDDNKFEIWYLSYNAKPKEWYRVDKFFHKVDYDEVAEIYKQCHLLIKTSLLESFSYPPLEMMATGGQVIAVVNDGNKEYIRDGENCLTYQQGNIEEAIAKINEIAKNIELQKQLYSGGLQTAYKYSWENLRSEIVKLYVNEV